MRIWVDADACPVVIKEILYRAATRVKRELILVANRRLAVPPSPFIRSVRVEGGFDVADRHIEDAVAGGDLVITADIPLAAAVVAKGALALNPRGELYTVENVREHLSRRSGRRRSGPLRAGSIPYWRVPVRYRAAVRADSSGSSAVPSPRCCRAGGP